MKDKLQELKQYLEELKTVERTKLSTSDIYKDKVFSLNGGKYILLDDIIGNVEPKDIDLSKILTLPSGDFIALSDMATGQFMTTEKYECSLNNGEVITREKLLKARRDGSAVIIVPVTVDNEVIVTVEPRVFTANTTGVGFPAGYIEKGEEPHISALRELQEEVGCLPKYLIELSRFYQDEGVSGAKNVAFLALGCTEGHEKNPDPGEFIRYVKCNFNEVMELERDGYIEGANSIIAIAKAKPYFSDRGKVKKLKVMMNRDKIIV